VNARSLIVVLAVAGFVLPAAGLLAQSKTPKVYRWVDDDGVVQFGDHIPPEYANRDREIINRQGVVVGFEEGEVTAEERAEAARQAEIDAAAQVERADSARRDRMLLETYLTVSDIEDLRDRRLELIDSQIKVTELYLSNLRKRLVMLEREASVFSPYSEKENAPPLPANLALDISRANASIELYEDTLDRSRREQDELRDAFDGDIARFKELKGG
jgi:hypothetical protein